MIQIIQKLLPIVRKEIKQAVPTFPWATVTSISPLRIRIDGEPEPLPYSPGTNVSGLREGDRVQCYRPPVGRLTIIGINGGGRFEAEIPLTDTANFETWGGAFPPLTCTASANMVTINGTLRCTTAGLLSGSTAHIVGYVPEHYEPSHRITVTGSGSSISGQQCYHQTRIDPDGSIQISRYAPVANTSSALVQIAVTYVR